MIDLLLIVGSLLVWHFNFISLNLLFLKSLFILFLNISHKFYEKFIQFLNSYAVFRLLIFRHLFFQGLKEIIWHLVRLLPQELIPWFHKVYEIGVLVRYLTDSLLYYMLGIRTLNTDNFGEWLMPILRQ